MSYVALQVEIKEEEEAKGCLRKALGAFHPKNVSEVMLPAQARDEAGGWDDSALRQHGTSHIRTALDAVSGTCIVDW